MKLTKLDINSPFTYHQEEDYTCPECDSSLIINQATAYCTDIKCSECDYTYYSDNYDGVEYNA